MSSTMVYAGKVRGKPRPRARQAKGHVYMYSDPKQVEYEETLRGLYKAQGGKYYPGAVAVHIIYRRPMPKRAPKKYEYEDDCHKPDADNVAKAVLDALNGVAFEDDTHVVQLMVNKLPRRRGYEERMIVTVKPVTDGLREWMEALWRRLAERAFPCTKLTDD